MNIMLETRNVESRPRGKIKRAPMDSGFCNPNLVAVATTNKIPTNPTIFYKRQILQPKAPCVGKQIRSPRAVAAIAISPPTQELKMNKEVLPVIRGLENRSRQAKINEFLPMV